MNLFVYLFLYCAHKFVVVCDVTFILGDPGADKGGEGKSKRAEKYGTKKSKERRSLLFFVPYFSTRLDFPASPLSAPGSPRMCHFESDRF